MHKSRGSGIAIAVLVIVVVCVALGAAPANLEQEQVGRYQLVANYETLVVLDTATGQCWRLQKEREWRDLGNPVHGSQPASADKEPVALDLPDERIEVTVRQRESEPLPGSDNRILLRLGDITEGQVLLQIQDEEGKSILREQSVQEGDVVEFEVAGTTYYLQVERLTNVLAGTDFGLFTISKTAPPEANEPAPADR